MANCRASSILVLLLTGVVTDLEQVPFRHLDIFMLCSNDIRETFDYVLELDGFYTNLLPTAVDMTINEGSQKFLNCMVNEDRMRVQIGVDAFALLDFASPLDQAKIQNLLTHELLASYFETICDEMDAFEALISDAGLEPQLGIVTALSTSACDFDDETVDQTGIFVGTLSLLLLCCDIVVGCILSVCRGQY
jgi:hypothetical protein